MSNREENSRRTTTTGSGNKKEVEERDATRRDATRGAEAQQSVQFGTGYGTGTLRERRQRQWRCQWWSGGEGTQGTYQSAQAEREETRAVGARENE